MVMMGYLGAKTKRGFYDWSDPKNPRPLDVNG
jgi:3-hydroxyacyl-CoA dehydrogenase